MQMDRLLDPHRGTEQLRISKITADKLNPNRQIMRADKTRKRNGQDMQNGPDH